ncbi:mycothiol synthase [Brachybacterium sp. MASK1Z-5]|uniref:Mycothiol acetyltransferase n=1 Tax=Brachybacterium halotolerans TaxID=2795215 RepID=A0ABS1BBH3_9MICO|nr:mycothiol synthase [Brachybacterium halotolerans]MBK0332027.1 mycothiol synthase [Brachybacterium halotolerans]
MIVTDELRPAQRPAVDLLLERTRAHDGVAALDEAALFALHAERADGTLHLLLADSSSDSPGSADSSAPARALAYASVLPDGTAQGAVDPEVRRRGLGSRLLDAVLERRPDAGIWAHGALDASLAFLRERGLEPVRELLTMRRVLGQGADGDAGIPAREPRDPAIALDAFDPARDADAWVRVNARAFAGHPEQGRLTRADLDERMAQPWFRADDLHVARRDGELLGFVWVKREEAEDPRSAPDAEIYAVGTDPDAAGQGVAGALLNRALRALAADGVGAATLYVEGDNTPALGLYEHLGFDVSGRDLQFRRGRGAGSSDATDA